MKKYPAAAGKRLALSACMACHEIFQNHWSLKEIWLRNGPHYFPLTRILLTLFGKFELGPKTLILFNDLLTFSFLWIFQKIIKKETLEQNHWFENFLLGSFLLSFCQREVFFFSFNFHFVFIVFLLYSLQKAIQKNPPKCVICASAIGAYPQSFQNNEFNEESS